MALALVALLLAACSAGPDEGSAGLEEGSAGPTTGASSADPASDLADDAATGDRGADDEWAGDDEPVPEDRAEVDAAREDEPDDRPDDPDTSDTWHDPVRVAAPSIEVAAEVIPLGLRDDGTIEVPPDGADAGWYRHGARPGEPGPTVIGAHVDWSGEPGVFFELGDLVPGDEVTVTDEAGTDVTYRVDHLEQHEKSAFPTFEVYGATAEDTLRLVTCAGPFDPSARSHRDNLVVFATAVG